MLLFTMVTVTLHGDRMSPCTLRIEILLEELNLKYNFESNCAQTSVTYGDNHLYETRSILRYISKNNTDDLDLTLDDAFEVDMWLETESQMFNPLISKIVNEKLFKKWEHKKPDESLVRETLEELKQVLDKYEARLSESKYIGGDYFSIADISHIPYLNFFVTCNSSYKSFLKEYPHVYKWFKRMMMRESVKDVLSQSK